MEEGGELLLRREVFGRRRNDPEIFNSNSERGGLRARPRYAGSCLLREDLETRRSKWEEDSEEAINRSSQVLYYSIA